MIEDMERRQRLRQEPQTPLGVEWLAEFASETLTASDVPSRPDRRSILAPVACMICSYVLIILSLAFLARIN